MKEKFSWKPEYSVGVATVDQQHQELFKIFNRLYAAVTEKKTPKAAAATMHEMSKYIGEHFNFEEPLIEKHPDFDTHHLEHLNFVENTLDFQIRFAEQDKDLHMDMLKFLADWLKNHILEMDKEHFAYLQEHKLLNNN